MSKKDEALKLALEALERHAELGLLAGSTITAIREALADSALDRMAENARELGLDYEPPCKTGSQCTSKCQQCEQPAQQQEPVAVYVGETWCGSVVRLYEELPLETPLYTSPPASKPWVGLTEEEVDECYYWKGRQWTTDELVRHVEAKLREKNA